MTNEIESYLSTAKMLATQAGKLILSHFKKENEVFNKSEKDFALSADLEAEKLIITKLQELYPSHSILSEEMGETDGNSNYKWIVDPLDGTANFKSGIPYFCVPIALSKNDEVIMSVIYNPLTRDIYHAVKGNGAYCNDEKIMVSDTFDVKKFLVSYSTSNHKNAAAISLGGKSFNILLQNCRSVRLQGSSILDLCNLASGTFDALIKVQASYWDFAAGCLLVEEAGGKVTSWSGDKWGDSTINLIATNSKNHEGFVSILND